MSVNMLRLRADLLLLRDTDLQRVRDIVTEALLVNPDDKLAKQEVQNVFAAQKKDSKAQVRCTITAQPTPGEFTTLTEIYDPLVNPTTDNFMPAIDWLYEFFGSRR